MSRVLWVKRRWAMLRLLGRYCCESVEVDCHRYPSPYLKTGSKLDPQLKLDKACQTLLTILKQCSTHERSALGLGRRSRLAG